ncbi:TSUP family transporter [Rhodobacterales bacterium HKCCE3408]|nr:TSUP family transporter [Rhodobacterales bacterium HKCCE3408]
MTGLGVDPGAWAFCAAAVAIGALVQRIAGQGFGMIAAPLVAIAAPTMLPASLLVLGFVVGWRATAADRRHLDWSELPWGMAGRTAGAVVAAILAGRLLDGGGLGVAVACTVFAAIALSLMGLRLAITRTSLVLAGLAAGVMGTLTAIGAPPMAILYQHEARARSAAMQNAFFLFGMAVSIGTLTLAGLVTVPHLAFAASLLPAVAIGLWVSEPVGRMATRLPARAIALGLSGVAATVLLVRSL